MRFKTTLCLFLLLLWTVPAWSQPAETPDQSLIRFQKTVQTMARNWVKTKPNYEAFQGQLVEAYRPYLSKAALAHVNQRGNPSPPEPGLDEPDEDPGVIGDEMQAEIMAIMANSKFQITDQAINGNKATVKATVTLVDPQSGTTENFQESYELVKEDGVWKITPNTLKLFTL